MTSKGQPDKTTSESLVELLQRQATRQPDAEAILAAGRKALDYSGVWTYVCRMAAALRARGIERGDRVAIVLPNGPDMALAFFGVSAAATAAPLNPAYREAEIDFYLDDLDARAVIVPPTGSETARAVARERQIPVLELQPWESGALDGPCDISPESVRDLARPDDVALILHTSGTTSRPKMVPLLHRNICVSAVNVAGSLALTREDRCLNVMPLFHIHGLVAAVTSSLYAGGSVVCSSGFNVERFYGQLCEFRPTWYTAVPTMHQAVLAAADEFQHVFANMPLRFIRSCSSALPPTVMEQLEDRFSVPVVEAYGMTEAAHQMTCNPLPPATRKQGSVGVPTGIDVAIMDEQGNLLPVGASGEVVIRGGNVTPGYANNPAANEQSFTAGWFRTGDQGVFDQDGYLSLTGRLKEMINRGGENISPREIDELLLEHPHVEQALTFAVPHATLGENVAVAIVATSGAGLTAHQVRQFAATRLSDFKVPEQVIFVEELPKGPTGKPQRIGLAEKLGLVGQPREHEAATATLGATEQRLALIWESLLGSQHVHGQHSFFQLGGDSLRATQMLHHVRDELGVELTLESVFEFPTLAELAGKIDEHLGSDARENQPQRMAG